MFPCHLTTVAFVADNCVFAAESIVTFELRAPKQPVIRAMHFERPWTDTNYGNIFSIWDRIFGTLVYEKPTDVRYGLDVLDDLTDENLLYQLKIPFDSSIKTDS